MYTDNITFASATDIFPFAGDSFKLVLVKSVNADKDKITSQNSRALSSNN